MIAHHPELLILHEIKLRIEDPCKVLNDAVFGRHLAVADLMGDEEIDFLSKLHQPEVEDTNRHSHFLWTLDAGVLRQLLQRGLRNCQGVAFVEEEQFSDQTCVESLEFWTGQAGSCSVVFVDVHLNHLSLDPLLDAFLGLDCHVHLDLQ